MLFEDGLGRQVGEQLVGWVVFDYLAGGGVDVLTLDDTLGDYLCYIVYLFLLLVATDDFGAVWANLYKNTNFIKWSQFFYYFLRPKSKKS